MTLEKLICLTKFLDIDTLLGEFFEKSLLCHVNNYDKEKCQKIITFIINKQFDIEKSSVELVLNLNEYLNELIYLFKNNESIISKVATLKENISIYA